MDTCLDALAEAALVASHEGATSLAALLRARADVPPGMTRERLRPHAAMSGKEATRAACRRRRRRR